MPTYAENAAARERASRKLVQDRQLHQQYAEFDLSAKDNHMKYERPSFVVVTASKAYRDGWDRIFASPTADKAGSKSERNNSETNS